jgi:hypothetical protein
MLMKFKTVRNSELIKIIEDPETQERLAQENSDRVHTLAQESLATYFRLQCDLEELSAESKHMANFYRCLHASAEQHKGLMDDPSVVMRKVIISAVINCKIQESEECESKGKHRKERLEAK